MSNSLYASQDGRKLGVFEGDSNHMLLFEYISEHDVVEVSIKTGDMLEGRFSIKVHDNQMGRKFEGLLGVEHYFQRIREMVQDDDNSRNLS